MQEDQTGHHHSPEELLHVIENLQRAIHELKHINSILNSVQAMSFQVIDKLLPPDGEILIELTPADDVVDGDGKLVSKCRVFRDASGEIDLEQL